MQVHMDCSGCENKIKKALKKIKGINFVDVLSPIFLFGVISASSFFQSYIWIDLWLDGLAL